MKILIAGAQGQVGKELVTIAKACGHEVIAASRGDLDVTKEAGVIAFIGIFFERYAVFFILVTVFLLAIYTFIYSYFEYQKEVK